MEERRRGKDLNMAKSNNEKKCLATEKNTIISLSVIGMQVRSI